MLFSEAMAMYLEDAKLAELIGQILIGGLAGFIFNVERTILMEKLLNILLKLNYLIGLLKFLDLL